MAIRMADTLRTARAQAVIDAIDADASPGRLKIYAGAKPGTKGAAPAGALLADIELDDPCGTVTAGVITITTPQEDPTADASGTAAFFYIEDGAGTFVFDGDVGAELTMPTTTITAGQPVRLTSCVFTEGNA